VQYFLKSTELEQDADKQQSDEARLIYIFIDPAYLTKQRLGVTSNSFYGRKKFFSWTTNHSLFK